MIYKNQRLFIRRDEISKRSRDARFRHQKKHLEDLLLDSLFSESEELFGLCWRLLDDFSRIWIFSEYVDVDPTNNFAERDLYKIVLWRKKSYATRSERGERFVERISSVSQPLMRSGKNVFEFVRDSVIAFYQRVSAPAISPEWGVVNTPP